MTDKWEMIFLLLVLNLIHADSAVARSSSRTRAYRSVFVHQKIHLTAQERISSEKFLALFDNTCLRRTPAKMKHKISAALTVQAYAVEKAELANVESHPCLIGASRDQEMRTAALPSDSLLAEQAHLPTIGFAETQGLWDWLPKVKQSVTVAVIDSGVEINHPDLQNQFWHAVDGSIGYDFLNDDAIVEDGYGHGTHVAGLIAAQTNNGLGISAIARNVRLMILKTLDSEGKGPTSNVVNAIRWAADHGADVINLSLAAPGTNAALLDALEYAIGKSVVIIVAAGNQAMKIDDSNFMSPIGYAGQIPGVIGVGSFDVASMSYSNFSNYSTANVKIAAPGQVGFGGILSTYLGGTYRDFQGTSMASPIVASATAVAVGFLQTHNVAWTPELIEEILALGSIEDPYFSSQVAGARRLHLPTLMKTLTHSFYFDSTGGFDEAP